MLLFSGMGYVVVATLVASGLTNSWFLVDSLSNLLTTPYGQVLLGKLEMFAAIVALAAANRFWIGPLMSATQAAVSASLAAWTRRLRNHVLGEQFLGLIVLLAVRVLGTMQPAAGRQQPRLRGALLNSRIKIGILNFEGEFHEERLIGQLARCGSGLPLHQLCCTLLCELSQPPKAMRKVVMIPAAARAKQPRRTATSATNFAQEWT